MMLSENTQEDINNFTYLKNSVINHQAINHPLFTYLNSNNIEGFNSDQYRTYQLNFFYRTIHTIPSIANLLISAAYNFDHATIALVGENIYDESGKGNVNNTHSSLLEKSHNSHAAKVFNLEPITLEDVYKSKSLISCVIPEAVNFVQKQSSLYKNSNYMIVLGAAYAHESAANAMLNNFYNAFFCKYKNYYNDNDFIEISNYFTHHLDGTEERHASDMEKIMINSYSNKDNIPFLIEGAHEFLDAQSKLWDGLHHKLLSLSSEEKTIHFRF